MKTKDDLRKDFTKRIRCLVIGTSGSGKTHFAHTFPKTYTINCEPGGMDTVAGKVILNKNLVGYDSYIPADKNEIKNILIKLKEDMVKVREMAIKGEIETVILDNITYLADTLFIYFSEICPSLDNRGNMDKFAAFRELENWLRQFMLKLLTMPCHVIVTCHEKLENDEAMVRKSDKNNPIVANILGGFRNKIEGMFSYVLYISKIEKGGKYEYWARSNKGNQKNGKSRITLSSTIQNISYETLLSEIKKCSIDKGAK